MTAMLASMSLILAAVWNAQAAGATPRDSVLLLSVALTSHELDPATGEVGRQIANGEDAVVSPNRARVAYVRETTPCAIVLFGFCFQAKDLLTADLAGGGERAIVESLDDGVSRFSPDWSPDGSRILFSWAGLPGEGNGLAWVRPDGSGLETILNGGWHGTFSPDGKWIAYLNIHTLDIHVMNVATRQTRALTSDGTASGGPPDWSPDGKQITYASQQGIVRLDAKTGEAVNLTEGWTAAVSSFETPVYSPDGGEIAFSAIEAPSLPEGESVRRIFAVGASGGVPRTVADQNGRLTDWVRL
jgi:TolB protein